MPRSGPAESDSLTIRDYMNTTHNNSCRFGHTLMELVVAMVASVVLLGGLASVMMIGSQVAYTPTAAQRRTESASVINQIAEELRHATLIIQQTPQILEFVVADRDGDGADEKIRYQWSGTPGDPLNRTLNATAAVPVLNSVSSFVATFELTSDVTVLKTTTDTAEQVLAANTAVQDGNEQKINPTEFSANQVSPSMFSAIPANALTWNVSKIDFYGSKSGGTNETLLVQIRATGESANSPTSNVLGQATVAESTLSGSNAWNTVDFPSPIRGLALHRPYVLVFAGLGGDAARIRVNDSFPTGYLESTDSGATWRVVPMRQMFGRIYGYYTLPGPTYNITRNYVSHVRIVLQSAQQAHGRIDASIPVANEPELLAAYWRTDFDYDPTIANVNGDAVADWALAGGGSFDGASLINGVWYASGALETRPLNDFVTPTIIETRCRNSSIGGNGAVIRISADRQGGLHAPLLVYVKRQGDGSQTVTLLGKTSDAATRQLFTSPRLSDEFIRLRLTILPQNNVVNLRINDEDQGTFTYPTYAPSSTNDRFLTLYGDSSTAEFDYVDVRVATN